MPVRNCYRLPESVPLAHAPLIEPLSTIVRGFDIVDPKLGDNFLIYGASTMGLLYLQVAQRAGAASVSVVDINEDRLAVARKLGYGRAVELLGKGVIDSETMITHRFGLDEYAKALDTFRQGSGRKLQIVPSGPAA